VDPARGSGTSALILSPGRGQPRVSLNRFQVERLPEHGKRLTVRLRFVLTGPARVMFFVFGPAPNCSLAGRFTIAGHAGLNSVPFRGRIRGRPLRYGIYTIVPQATTRAARLRGPRVAIMIDARGVHPAAPMPSGNCRSATKAAPLLSLTPRDAGVAGAIATERATPAHTPAARGDSSLDKPKESQVWILPSAGKLWLIIAFTLASLTLLGLAAVEPSYTATRFHLIRVLETHRAEVALSGGMFLAAAAMLFVSS
jgi:hypothetical protein